MYMCALVFVCLKQLVLCASSVTAAMVCLERRETRPDHMFLVAVISWKTHVLRIHKRGCLYFMVCEVRTYFKSKVTNSVTYRSGVCSFLFLLWMFLIFFSFSCCIFFVFHRYVACPP